MGFDSSGDDFATISQINVTPLVDVMLVLLVIFMVAAPILQQGVELELPQETIAPLSGQGEQLVVSIDKDAKVYIGKSNNVILENLGTKLKAILERREDKSVYLRADYRVTYGEVMKVMAKIKQSGIEKVGLVTEPEV